MSGDVQVYREFLDKAVFQDVLVVVVLAAFRGYRVFREYLVCQDILVEVGLAESQVFQVSLVYQVCLVYPECQDIQDKTGQVVYLEY